MCLITGYGGGAPFAIHTLMRWVLCLGMYRGLVVMVAAEEVAADARGVAVHAFTEECLSGNINTAHAMHAHHRFSLADLRAHAPLFLVDVCDSGRIPLANWLQTTFEFTNADMRYGAPVIFRLMLMRLVGDGHGDHLMAAWIHEHFGITREDAVAQDNLMFRSACKHGDLDAAKWLHSTFMLTADDARACDYAALRAARIHNRVGVANWLVNNFGE